MSSALRLTAVVLLSVLVGCAPAETDVESEPTATPAPPAAAGTDPGPVAYAGRLVPLNPGLTGTSAAGRVLVAEDAGSFVFRLEIEGLPPSMMHLQHVHGFADNREGVCPGPEADTNGDGVVDLLEATEVAGVTLIPLHDDPAGLQIVAETYPKADAEGSTAYRQSVDLASLESALAQAHGIDTLELGSMTVLVHGVPADAGLPETAQSLPDVPARLTVPVACAELDRVH